MPNQRKRRNRLRHVDASEPTTLQAHTSTMVNLRRLLK
jgi:hypothetical protein